jgi:hypothetical protein
MTSREELISSYAAWRRWTEKEGEAIARADWTAVAECQQAKRPLQPEILRLTQAVAAEAPRDGTGREEIRAILADLIALEEGNDRALKRERARQERRQAELNVAGCNLGRVQRSYVQPLASGWHSYS